MNMQVVSFLIFPGMELVVVNIVQPASLPGADTFTVYDIGRLFTPV